MQNQIHKSIHVERLLSTQNGVTRTLEFDHGSDDYPVDDICIITLRNDNQLNVGVCITLCDDGGYTISISNFNSRIRVDTFNASEVNNMTDKVCRL